MVNQAGQPERKFSYNFFYLFLSLSIGAALIILSFLGYYMTGDRFAGENTIAFGPEKLKLIAGQGMRTSQGIEVRRLAEQGSALVISINTQLPADFFSEFSWNINNLKEETEIRLAWIQQSAPNAINEVTLVHYGMESGQISLADVPEWRGIITGIGLRIRGPLPEPITVHNLELKPASPSAGFLLASLWREWTAFEGWKGYTINFVVGGPLKSALPPTVTAAAWFGLSSLIYIGLVIKRRASWSVQAFAVLFLVAWLALDARWQLDLWRQLQLTYSQFAGKNWREKHLADSDGKLFQFIESIKEKLPDTDRDKPVRDKPVRLFVVSAKPNADTFYQRARAHYHLLPYNVFSGLSHPPSPKVANAGDYVLILRPVPDLSYDPNNRLLRWENGNSLAVERIYSTRLGDLFKVRM